MKNSKQILINSELNPGNANLVSGSGNEFSYHISNDNSYTHVICLGLSVPISYYLIQEGYNTFTLLEGAIYTSISIPAGNYNSTSFATVVKGLLNTYSAHDWTYNMTFPNDFVGNSTGKYVYSVSGNDSQPSLIFADNELHKQFGFTHSSTNTFVSNTLTSTSIVDFIPENTLTIWSDICDDTSLLTVFSNNVVPFSKLGWEAQTDLYAKRFTTTVNNTYRFSLLGSAGSKISLNGLGLCINLLLFTPDDQSYKQDIKNYIRYRIAS